MMKNFHGWRGSIAAAVVVLGSNCASPGIGSVDRTPAAVTKRQTLEGFRPQDITRIPVAFFDADSTLRVAVSGQVTANAPNDVAILPCVPQRLRQLAIDGYLIAVVSNQGGVAAAQDPTEKARRFAVAEQALAFTVGLITQGGGVVHHFDFAEGKEGEDPARKPDIGMATRLEDNLKKQFGQNARIDLARSFMVGDSAYVTAKDEARPRNKDIFPIVNPRNGQLFPAGAGRTDAVGRLVDGDTRPEGAPGSHFSHADRLFAEKLFTSPRMAPWKGPKRFYEPDEFFGWREAMGGNSLAISQALGEDRVFTTVAEIQNFNAKFPKACCVVEPALPICRQ
jgi:HAD superfamily hydrolase (TIGR01662 family)